MRAGRRASVSSSSASSPVASGSAGSSSASLRASRTAGVAQARPDQPGPGRGRVPLGEDQVHHPQHVGEAAGQVVRAGHPERDRGLPDLALGPHQPLGHRRLRYQERGGDLGGGEAAHRPQRERHPHAAVEGGVAAGEDQRQLVVAHRLVLPARRQTAAPPGPAATPTPAALAAASRRAAAASFSGRRASRRSRSSALCRATPTSQARGLASSPQAGQRSTASAHASATASSATSRSPTMRATVATAPHQWARNSSSFSSVPACSRSAGSRPRCPPRPAGWRPT